MEPADLANQAFGKLDQHPDGSLADWHPLIDHLFDVAACFAAIAACRGPRRALAQAAGRPLSKQDLRRLAVLVFLHDLGKANSGFQAKRWRHQAPPRHWPPPAGHGAEALMLFTPKLADLLAPLPIDAINDWGEGVESLLWASISHHGWPLPAQVDPHVAPWQPVRNPQGQIEYDPSATLRAIGAALAEHFADALAPGGATLPEAPGFAYLFAGLVQLADWLGSSRDFFAFSRPGEQRAATAPGYALDAVRTLGLDAEHWQASLAARAPAFDQVFGFPPRPLQQAMLDDPASRLLILEAETGSGKTEAALWRFLNLFATGTVDALYFALPTRVAASQVYRRIHETIARLWPDAPPLCVRALPGYSAADGQAPTVLPRFEVLWPDRPDDAAAHRRWAAESPKRFLAAPVAVGTIDQALLATLQQRHAHLRLALLARSLLVVDEVHASDPYMTALLERLLAAHLGHGGHALLLSATLGSAARARYLAIARGGALSGRAAPPDLAIAAALPYPLLSARAGGRALAGAGYEKPVTWGAVDFSDDPAAIARLALAAAGENARVLIVRNTVPAAVAVLQALEALAADPAWLFTVAGRVTLHHGRFSREDRPLLDAAIEAQLGKARPVGPLIAIGTQTLEQSLDLDADLLITDLCPMDVLLQRIGRLHRHAATPRPPGYEAARVLVLTPPGGDLTPCLNRARHGLGRESIYTDLRAVEATRRLIGERPTVTLPRDNRGLVEAATHPTALLAIEQALGEGWERVGQGVEGRAGADRGMAILQAIDFSQPFDQQEPFPQGLRIATRLGLNDRLAAFPPGTIGPFGGPLGLLPIRAWLLPDGVDPEATPEAIQADADGVSFTFGGTALRYSRYGLDRAGSDQ